MTRTWSGRTTLKVLNLAGLLYYYDFEYYRNIFIRGGQFFMGRQNVLGSLGRNFVGSVCNQDNFNRLNDFV